MGLFANIVNKIAASPVGKALDYGASILAHPISTVKDLVTGNIKDIKATKETFVQQSTGKQITQILTGTAIVGAAVVTAGAVGTAIKAGTALPAVANAAKSVVGAVAKSAVAHPIQTAAAVLIGAPTVAGILTKKPELITELPKTAFQGGQKLVTAIEEHPTVAAVIGSVTGGVLAYEIGSKLLGGDSTSTVKVETPTTNPTFSTMPVNTNAATATRPDAVLDFSGTKPLAPAPTVPTSPPTAQTGSSKAPTTRKRRKAAKKQTPQIISQRVNVLVSNKSTSTGMKNYIKRGIYN